MRKPTLVVEEFEGLQIVGPAKKVAGALALLAAGLAIAEGRARVSAPAARPPRVKPGPKQDAASRKEHSRKIKLGLARRRKALEASVGPPPKPLKLKPKPPKKPQRATPAPQPLPPAAEFESGE